MRSAAAASRAVPGPARARDGRAPYPVRGRVYWLGEREARCLADVGAFRVVPAVDLAKHVFGGSVAVQEAAAERLRGQGLVEIVRPRETPGTAFLALTVAGKRLVEVHELVPEGQTVYAGVKQGRQLAHDAGLYDIFHKAVASHVPAGSTVLRVELDYELKSKVGRERAGMCGLEFGAEAQRAARAAAVHGLTAVGEHVVLPDVRIVYRDVAGEVRNLDVEHVTRWSRNVADKRAAGFRIYGDARAQDKTRRAAPVHRAWLGR